MKANGLYTINGKPADEWKNGDKNKSNDDGDEIQKDSTKTINKGGTYRYNGSAAKIDSLKIDLQKVQQSYKDSLLKEQNDIKKKQEENQKKLEKLNVTKTETEPVGNLMLQSYSPIAIIGIM